MRIHLELFGLARLVTGKKEIALDIESGATFQDLVQLLGERYPSMIGDVIQPDGQALQFPNVFNLNARRMIKSHQMDEPLNDGDRIILMSMSAGG